MVSLGFKGFDLPYELRIIGDGELALDFLKKKGAHAEAPTPDLVLLDWYLPGKNGLEVLLEMKQDPALRNIPVLVMTGIESDEITRNAYDAGANLFMMKPALLYRYTATLKLAIETFKNAKLLPDFGPL